MKSNSKDKWIGNELMSWIATKNIMYGNGCMKLQLWYGCMALQLRIWMNENECMELQIKVWMDRKECMKL